MLSAPEISFFGAEVASVNLPVRGIGPSCTSPLLERIPDRVCCNRPKFHRIKNGLDPLTGLLHRVQEPVVGERELGATVVGTSCPCVLSPAGGFFSVCLAGLRPFSLRLLCPSRRGIQQGYRAQSHQKHRPVRKCNASGLFWHSVRLQFLKHPSLRLPIPRQYQDNMHRGNPFLKNQC